MTVTIRALSEPDADELARLHLDTWRAAYGALLPPDAFDTVDLAERSARWRLRARGEDIPVTSTLVAVAGPALAGFVSFGPPRDEPAPATTEVYALYVAPDRWRAGVGRALLAAAVRGIEAAGDGAAYLWVLEANDRARAFYERMGFAHDGTTKPVDLFGTPLPETRYVRRGMGSGSP